MGVSLKQPGGEEMLVEIPFFPFATVWLPGLKGKSEPPASIAAGSACRNQLRSTR